LKTITDEENDKNEDFFFSSKIRTLKI